MIHGSPKSPILALPEIFRVTVRQLLGRRRTLLLLLLAALPLLLALVFRLFDRIDVQRYSNSVFDGVLVAIVLPLTAVLFGTGAFGAELDEGTALYLLAKPLPRWAVVLAKAMAAAALTLLLTVGSILAGALVEVIPAGDVGVRATEAYVGATVVGGLCYVAVFVAASMFTRRALVIGIGYTLIWEGLLSSLLPGIANLSIRQYALGVGDWFAQLGREPARLPPETAVLLSVVVVVAALALATWRLMHFELSGGTD
jgi:ABC-2 type transport system permease protein